MSARRRAMVALVISGSAALVARAAPPELPRDGWASWSVAVGDAPAWCCFDLGASRDGARAACKLDGHDSGFGARDGERTDTLTLYAHSTAGRLDRLRVMSATCPIDAQTPISTLTVTPDDSARWLISRIGTASDDTRSEIIDNAFAALSMQREAAARAGLTALGESDPRADVRTKAWFWLAMSGSPGAEAAIGAALRADPDSQVREQAVFALSRLPDERATRALIAAVEDRSLPREQRKRAVFWLSQSESAAAEAYLDKLLATR